MSNAQSKPTLSLVAAGLLYTIIIGTLAALWLYPERTFRFGIEDGPIENISAILLVVAAISFAFHAARLVRSPDKKIIGYIGFALAVCFLFLAGEEISWGQRIFDIESGEFMLEYNWQNELNLHNLNTDIANTGYHIAAFVFLVAAPLFRKSFTKLFKRIKIPQLSAFIPPLWIAFPSFALLGMLDPRFVYNVHKPWAAALYLGTLVIGLTVLAYRLVHDIREKNSSYIIQLLLSLLLIAAGLFVSYLQSKDSMPNTVSEYKEFYIALALCFFALQWRGNTSTLDT